MVNGLPIPKLGPWGLAKKLLATEGVAGLYRGLTATFVREIPGYFFFFLAYEGVRELLKPEGGNRSDVGALGTVGAGAVAGVVLWSLIFPVDVVKSRLAVSGAATPLLVMLASIQKVGSLTATSKFLLHHNCTIICWEILEVKDFIALP